MPPNLCKLSAAISTPVFLLGLKLLGLELLAWLCVHLDLLAAAVCCGHEACYCLGFESYLLCWRARSCGAGESWFGIYFLMCHLTVLDIFSQILPWC